VLFQYRAHYHKSKKDGGSIEQNPAPFIIKDDKTMSKRQRKKRASLQRAAPMYPPGGAMMYVSPQQTQSMIGQTFYGTTLKNLPVGQTALFSPGTPLPTQPSVNPNGLPIQFRFPVAYNSFPVDRSLGLPDVPSFEQLKRLAMMDYGVALCERYWLDMVPRMTLKISLSPDAIAGGAEEKQYAKEKAYFQNFFEHPDGQDHLHSWIRKALINQSRYDELYIYKNKARGGKLLGLEIIDGSQMKPLLDDWGRTPQPPRYAYQQWPWGIPGWQYRTDQMIHYRETPADDTPYGFSRVERIIFVTNLALRKQKMDLAHYTEGNVPAGILMPPEGSQWTPDQLDSYEQSWNALLAGNLQQLARIKVVQPGFSYTPFVQPNFDSVFDRFLLNIRTAAYGMTMSDLGFTESVNKSSGDTQENVTYRRTIGPLASIYASILTGIMRDDFPPEMHGDMFVISFGGYDEAEDLGSLSTAYTQLVTAGILGVSNAGKLLQLPEDPGSPHIGRILVTKDGPIFLDDMASDKLRNAAVQAKMAGLQMATQNPGAKPGQPQGDADETDEETQGQSTSAAADEEDQKPQSKKDTVTGQPAKTTNSKSSSTVASNNGDGDSKKPAQKTLKRVAESDESVVSDDEQEQQKADFRRWREIALKDVKAGKPVRTFTSAVIPPEQHSQIAQTLERCVDADSVRAVFKSAQDGNTDFFAVPQVGRSQNPNGDRLTNNNLLWRNALPIASRRS
jgi:hypothetical protein